MTLDPVGMDELKKRKNVADGKPLCEWCEGTGNQFYFMYSACPKCNGTGIAPPPPTVDGEKP